MVFSVVSLEVRAENGDADASDRPYIFSTNSGNINAHGIKHSFRDHRRCFIALAPARYQALSLKGFGNLSAPKFADNIAAVRFLLRKPVLGFCFRL